MLRKFKRKVKPISHLLWLFLLLAISVLVTNFYENYKNSQYNNLVKTLDNFYFQKTIATITSKLQDRFTVFEYLVKKGDNYETIINQLEISKKEKTIFLETIKKNKDIKILRPNQKINIKIDKKDEPKVIEFNIELSKKKEIQFVRDIEFGKFKSKLLEKNLKKVVTYKESKITNSLYQSALNLKMKPNIIIEFARLYGFQVDFQRDIWKNDVFKLSMKNS